MSTQARSVCLLLWASIAITGIALARQSELPRQYQPMFGGLNPEDARRLLSDADRVLLKFGPAADPDGVSAAWIRTGLKSYYTGDYNTAIRSFNLAWLTKPTNSTAVAALGVAAGARDGACLGAPLVQNATKSGPVDSTVAVDAVGTLANCVLQPENWKNEDAVPLYCSSMRSLLATIGGTSAQRTDSQFEIAIVSLTACTSYDDAWKQVALMRRLLGHEPRAELLDVLTKLAPEPPK